MGTVESIHVCDAGGAPMRALDRAMLVAGRGIAGDRYAEETGHYTGWRGVPRDLTLIEAEELERLAAEHGIALEPGAARRNLTVRGIRLAPLVGRRFTVGGVPCEATELCEPCVYLEGLLGVSLLRPLVHRAGIRAIVLEDGEIRPGDRVAAA